MKPRQRRAARRRAIRERYPVGTFIFVNATVQNRARASMSGGWHVYGYAGQALKIRRTGSQYGYVASLYELGYPFVRKSLQGAISYQIVSRIARKTA